MKAEWWREKNVDEAGEGNAPWEIMKGAMRLKRVRGTGV